jgi:hypothetical protein
MTAITLDERAMEYARQLEYRTAKPGPLDYLARHGISDRGVMARYALGCVEKPLLGDERYRGYMSIPYIGRRNVVSIKFRCTRRHDCHAVGNGHAKYAKDVGPVQVYNTAALFEPNDIIGIAEGEVDAIAATELLGLPTLGIPGAQQWAAHSRVWHRILEGYDRIVIFADGDDAGLECARAIAADVGDRHVLVKCDPGEDVSSMIAKGNAGKLKLKAGISGSD